MAQNVTAPMVGKIVDIKVKVGDRVQEDDEVAVMEAMKMENDLVSKFTGTVTKILVRKGSEVSTGDILLTIG